MRSLSTLVVALLAASAPIPALADGPAVSAVNGKASVESGVASSFGRSSAIGAAQGALTLPVGHSFGFELDALASTSHNAFIGGGLAQVFWRDPALGQVGPFAALAGGNGARLAFAGGEAQLFAPNLTLQGFGGWLDVAVSSPMPGAGGTSGGFYGSHLTLYPTPDLALSIGAQVALGRAKGSAQVEVLPELTVAKNVSLFVSASAGDNQAYRVTGGLRIYFGPDKSLIRRHREDDLSYGALFDARDDLIAATYAAYLSRDPSTCSPCLPY